MTPCQHGAAAHQNRRNINARRSHKHAGDNLVTVRYQHQSVKGMPRSHGLDAVCHQFTARQRKFHSAMPHGDTVANPNGGEFNGSSASGGNTHFNGFHKIAKVGMARYYFAKSVANANDWFFQIFRGIAHGIKKRTVSRSIRTLGGVRTTHIESSIFRILQGIGILSLAEKSNDREMEKDKKCGRGLSKSLLHWTTDNQLLLKVQRNHRHN